MPDDRFRSIENLLIEVVAKQDFLLASLQELRTTQLATTSEMKSQYVALEAMFLDISAYMKE
jgi:hypothetical protein